MTDITLQINNNGAWKNLTTFAADRREEVLSAVSVFAGVLGDNTRWCLLYPDGHREWLREPLSQWHPITADQPHLLEDVMVSTFVAGADESPVVYMAYRKPDGKFYLSGTFDEAVTGAYAWATVIEPMPWLGTAPEARQVAA